MFGFAFGQDAGPVEPGGFCYNFGVTTVGDTSYRSLDGAQASVMKMALVGWEASEPPGGAIIDEAMAIVRQPPDAREVLAVPLQGAAPRQVGNMYRWVEMQQSRGYGIVVVPPTDFDPCGDLLRWPSGTLRAVATKSLREAAALAGPEGPGVVVFAPFEGWSTGIDIGPSVQIGGRSVGVVHALAFGVAAYAIYKLVGAR